MTTEGATTLSSVVRSAGGATQSALEDLLARHLDLVVCGTGAGRRAVALRQYYAGRGNRVWRTLAEVGLTPRELSPSDYRELLNFGMGLTDLVKHHAGSDAGLRPARPMHSS